MYYNGYGVQKDDVEAVKWLRMAADQRYGKAENSLGLMYKNGEGVPQDIVQAYTWFTLAAAQGYADAVRNQRSIAYLLTSQQIADAARSALQLQGKK